MISNQNPLGLSPYALSLYFQLPLGEIEKWFQRSSGFPSKVRMELRCIKQAFIILADQAAELPKIFPSMTRLPVLRFTTQEDFVEFSDESINLKSVELHQIQSKLTAEKQEAVGIKIVVINFDRTEYLNWLKSKGKEKSLMNPIERAKWAILQAADA